MKVYFGQLALNTKKRKELIDITQDVQRIIQESAVENGMCLVHSMHSTSAVIVNENEGGLLNDIVRKVIDDFPEGREWQHNRIDDNADSHLAGAFLGPSVNLPIRNGRPTLGTWQSVFFLELDGPRSGRRIVVEVMGE